MYEMRKVTDFPTLPSLDEYDYFFHNVSCEELDEVIYSADGKFLFCRRKDNRTFYKREACNVYVRRKKKNITVVVYTDSFGILRACTQAEFLLRFRDDHPEHTRVEVQL